MLTTTLTRRALLGAAATLPAWDLALAQAPGGTLRIGMTLAAIPLSNGCPDQGGEGQRFMGITLYNFLVEWDLSRSDQPTPLKPGLATRWQADPANPKRWWFEIRQGVRFHDGKILTAEDVAFSFDRAFRRDAPWFDPRANAQVQLRLPTIADWGVEGPDRFWLETIYPDSTVPYGVGYIGVTHKGAWEAAGKSWDTFLNRAVGTGPWKLQSFAIRERAVLVRNADHWEASRIPRCERLLLLPLPDANTRVAALRSGQVDFIEAPPPDAMASLRSAGFQTVVNEYPHNWTWHFSMLEGSPWRDARIRKAANLAIDRTGIKEMLGGTMLEGAGIVTPDSPWYGTPSFKLEYAPDKARALLAEAGYGLRNPLRTKIAISAGGSGQMQPLAMNEVLQQNLKDVGIEVDYEVLEWNALLVIRREGAAKAAQRGITAINVSYGAGDPFTGFMRLMKADMAAPVGGNWGSLNDLVLEPLFQAAFATMDPAEQNRIVARIHTRVVDEALFLFVTHDLNPRAMSRRVKGFVQARNWSQDLTPISLQ
jgi:peptide/nickel transport system substrate-binding protein